MGDMADDLIAASWMRIPYDEYVFGPLGKPRRHRKYKPPKQTKPDKLATPPKLVPVRPPDMMTARFLLREWQLFHANPSSQLQQATEEFLKGS